MENAPLVGSGASASLLLGRKLDSIPFSIYHLQIILVLGVVGFVEGYDLALGGSLLLLLVLQSACGGGTTTGQTSYTVTVTAASGAIQHTTQVGVTLR